MMADVSSGNTGKYSSPADCISSVNHFMIGFIENLRLSVLVLAHCMLPVGRWLAGWVLALCIPPGVPLVNCSTSAMRRTGGICTS